jgi:hypothetical protein
MAPPNAVAALAALTDVDVELAVNGLARDLHLELAAALPRSRGRDQLELDALNKYTNS